MTDNFYAPPHSIEAEQAVIGGLLLDDDSSERVQKVLAMLKPDSFYSRPHKIIFEEITRMHREQKPVDGLTLFDELERKSLTASVGGFAYIAEIAKNTPSAANIVAYAMQVRETAMERYAINRMTEATELLYSRNGMTATQKYEAIQSIFTQLTDHAKTGSRRGLRSFGEVMEDWASDLEKRFDPSGEQRGMSTGIPSLDRMLSPKGLVKGSLFVIGARPKMGKTTLYSQMAINCAAHEKKPALMFSLEMPGDQILEKLVGQKSGVNPNIFYLPATNDADDGYQGDYDGDFNRAIETANRLSEIDLLYIDDTPGLSLAQIVSESRRIKREKGCVGMILVDYLTLMTAEKADRNDLAYGMITKGLKNLAKELDCVVVLLTQLNRALESRTNKRPLPSDSRDTGQIEQDCDYWVGIHREGAFDDSVPPGETELILRLNRHGNTGTVYCIQANGAIYDTDQQSAEMRRREREEPQSKKKGGFTARLVDRWRELEEAAVNIPKTLPEALRLAADLAEQKMQLENQLAIAAPKVEFADRVGEASGILIGNFAKVVGIGQNKLFAWMRDHKILIASGSRRNVPMQEYMDRGYFAVKETAVNTNHGIQISFTTKITGRGQQWLTRKLLDNGMLKVTGEAA
ncbi:AAA family ATPase [Escherichia coli]|nr:AAA family ATPase [Escherichia coli]